MLPKVLEHEKKRPYVQPGGETTPSSPPLSQASLTTNLTGKNTLPAPCDLTDPATRPLSTPPTTSKYIHASSSSGQLSVAGGSSMMLAAGSLSYSGFSAPLSGHDTGLSHQLPFISPTNSSSQGITASPRMLEGSTNVEINNSILTNAQNVTIYRFDAGDTSSPEQPPLPSPQPSWMNGVFRANKTIFKVFAVLAGSPGLGVPLESLEAKEIMCALLGKQDLEEFCGQLMKSVENLTMKEGLNTSQKLKDNLGQFYSGVSHVLQEIHDGDVNTGYTEIAWRKITDSIHSFVLVSCISGIVRLEHTLIGAKKHALHQCIQNLPRVEAAYNDYESKKKSGACFEGTREALLEEIAAWISALEVLQIYLLSGIASTGKSTVAHTIAERAERIGYLGASFFFSRDEAERSNAKRFFSTIAFQLCLYDDEFAHAIEKALLTERGLAAIGKDPITQLEALILEPLQEIVKSRSSPIVTVIDALDECDDRDAPIVLAALSRLVQELPCFKVVLTTRPQLHLPPVPNAHKVFHLQEIEEKIVDGDIRLYLEHSLSRENVSKIFPKLRKPWSASSQDIETLVRVAGRLFIIASTAVRFVLNPRFGDPERRMKGLRSEIDREQLSFKDLDRFYTIILRTAINEDSDRDTKDRYQDIIGTIIVIQEPLPIETLENLTGSWSADSIDSLLGDLQSVILIKEETPRIYHKSFSDFVTNCESDDLRIIPRVHHTRLAIRCFEIMNTCLRQNILDLGTTARFMNNDAGLAEEKISAERLMEKISRELQYACAYWANHLEGVDFENANLLQHVDTFIKEHLLHWLEASSWIGKLDTTTDALRVIVKSMKSLDADVHGIISDALYFIPKFYDRIRQSALHAYYSGLSFTPTKSLLLKSHSKDMAHCLCRPEGVPAQWDPLISRTETGNSPIYFMFSNDSSKFAARYKCEASLSRAENGTLLRRFTGSTMSIAYDFSVVATWQDSAVALWNVASNIPIATVASSRKVVKLALSFDGSRLAVGLSNGTVSLCDVWKGGESITSLSSYSHLGLHLEFAPRGYRLASMSSDGAMQLWDGSDGKLVGRLDYMSKKHLRFVFSRDGCLLASLVKQGGRYSLTIWGCEEGNLIGVAKHVGDLFAISEDGSFIATGEEESLQLWSGNSLLIFGLLNFGERVWSLAISHGILAIGCRKTLRLYEVKNRMVIVTLQQELIPRSLAFSPDFTRLAVGTPDGVSLYDIPSLRAFTPTSVQQASGRVYALAFSPDSTRLASGFVDGTVQLWAIHTNKLISAHKLHSRPVYTVSFSLGGDRLASGSDDRTVRLWDGRDGAPLQLLEHSFTDCVASVTFSRNLIAASTKVNITIFDRQSLHVISALEKGSHFLSFSADGSFLASAYIDRSTSNVTVWNVNGWIGIAEFRVDSQIDRLTFSPDGSLLAAQQKWSDGILRFFDLVNKRFIELTGHEDLHWIPNFVDGVLISWREDGDFGCRLVGRFVGHPSWVPILWIPREFNVFRFTVGSSMVALGCNDGRILFVRF